MRLTSLMTPGQIVSRVHQIIHDMQKADECLLARIDFDTITHEEMRALAASLLTGDTQFVRTVGETQEQASLAPDWGSWIEGQPVTTAILSNRALLVDLLPLDPAEFAATYRITVGQFIAIAKWFARNGKRLHINLRDASPDDPASIEQYARQTESIGLILQELEDNSLFYCLAARRSILFSLSDGNRPHDRQRLARVHAEEQLRVEEFYPALESRFHALPAREEWSLDDLVISGAAVRGGGLIAPGQMAWRIAYYRAYRAMFSDVAETRMDQLLDEPSPSVEEFAELARLATLYHHRFTAPITGAFGGTYNLTLGEYAPMVDVITASTPQDRIHGMQSHSATTEAEGEIWEWIATERVRMEDKRLSDSVSTAFAMWQRQQDTRDEVVDYILNQAKPITDDIQAYRSDLISAIRSNILKGRKLNDNELVSAQDYSEAFSGHGAGDLLGEMERAVEKANSVGNVISSHILMGFGLALGPQVAGIAGIGSLFISPDAISTVFAEAAKEPAKSGLASLIARMRGRTPENMQITSIMRRIGEHQGN